MQRDWAGAHAVGPGVSLDQNGYFREYAHNLRADMDPATEYEYDKGGGSELHAGRNGAKMCAPHSSAALVVNVFSFWRGRDLERVARALGLGAVPRRVGFERRLRIPKLGTPNLDVVLEGNDEIVGVEGKFTEWMTPDANRGASLAPYVDCGAQQSAWSEVGLRETHRLACALLAKTTCYTHLDAPQLLKHALGLSHDASGRRWRLLYVYFDAPGAAATAHARELEEFERAIGGEFVFQPLTYQAFVAALGGARDPEEAEYFAYLRGRYFPADATT